jgi:Protein of unknown function (DUF3750)
MKPCAAWPPCSEKDVDNPAFPAGCSDYGIGGEVSAGGSFGQLADGGPFQRRSFAVTRGTSGSDGADLRRADGSLARHDYTAWGEPIRVNGFVPDGRWFGCIPQTIAAADGEAASRMVPKIHAAVEGYEWRSNGDYRAWPGPNSNTFVAAVLAAVPELQVALPPTAIGKDFPYDGDVFGLTPSGTGIRVTLGGYLGLTIGWVEGLEINVLGAVFGIDLRRPAVKLPGLGRVGFGYL